MDEEGHARERSAGRDVAHSRPDHSGIGRPCSRGGKRSHGRGTRSGAGSRCASRTWNAPLPREETRDVGSCEHALRWTASQPPAPGRSTSSHTYIRRAARCARGVPREEHPQTHTRGTRSAGCTWHTMVARSRRRICTCSRSHPTSRPARSRRGRRNHTPTCRRAIRNGKERREKRLGQQKERQKLHTLVKRSRLHQNRRQAPKRNQRPLDATVRGRHAP